MSEPRTVELKPVSLKPGEPASRAENMLQVTRRLILLTAGALVVTISFIAFTLFTGEKFMVSWVCFGCGLVGGFVSIQQRLKKVSSEDLALLANSWFQIALIPVYGGIFALVIYVGFLSKIVVGDLFPLFSIPAFHTPPTSADMQAFFRDTYPVSGSDLAKLLFWCFVAGFSERLIPQILGKAEGGGAGK
jgi:hypothetical protein